MSNPHFIVLAPNKIGLRICRGGPPTLSVSICRIVITIAICVASAAPVLANFSSFQEPALPGQRKATAIIDLKGLSIDRVKVTIVFADNLSAVTNALNQTRERGQFTESPAIVTDLGNGTAACSFIFPHRDLPNVRGLVYDNPRMIYYAWSATFTPNNPTSQLPIASPVRSFIMPRFLIIGYIGDSYAAGEGAPNVEGVTSRQRWTDRDCHRSERSGGVLAIEQFKVRHPELAVRYHNVTCSGATVANLNVEFQDTKAPQLLQIERWLAPARERFVDILLAGGGGNTAGFAPAGAALLTPFHREIFNDEQVSNRLRDGIATLAGAYDAVISDLASARYFSVGRVVWMNYPTSLRDMEGNLCGPRTISGKTGLLDCWGRLLERNIKSDEITFINEHLFSPLNIEISNAVNRANNIAARGGPHWDLVNVESMSQKNGLCNCRESDPVGYFNTLLASFKRQLDYRGTMHPNATGYRRIYSDAVFFQLEKSIALWHAEVAAGRQRTVVGAVVETDPARLAQEDAVTHKRRRSVEQPQVSPISIPRSVLRQRSRVPELAPEDRSPLRRRVADRPDH